MKIKLFFNLWPFFLLLIFFFSKRTGERLLLKIVEKRTLITSQLLYGSVDSVTTDGMGRLNFRSSRVLFRLIFFPGGGWARWRMQFLYRVWSIITFRVYWFRSNFNELHPFALLSLLFIFRREEFWKRIFARENISCEKFVSEKIWKNKTIGFEGKNFKYILSFIRIPFSLK